MNGRDCYYLKCIPKTRWILESFRFKFRSSLNILYIITKILYEYGTKMHSKSYVSRQIAIVSMQETEIIVLDPRATKPPSPPFTHAKQYPLSSAVSSQGPPLNPHQRKTSPPTSTRRQSFHKSASIPRNTDTLFPSLFSLSNSRLHGSRSTKHY